jgi:hypothetical protein
MRDLRQAVALENLVRATEPGGKACRVTGFGAPHDGRERKEAMNTMTVIFTTLLMLGAASDIQTVNGDETSLIDQPAASQEETYESDGGGPVLFDGGVEPICLACR